jgi:hypothetical protein
MAGSVKKPFNRKYFMAYQGSTQHLGYVNDDQVMDSGMENVVIGDNFDDFLQKTETGVTIQNTEPLPASGEEVLGGKIYTHSGSLVICRQTHFRTADHPTGVPALFMTYRASGSGILDWIANEQVSVGDIRSYSGQDYTVIQSHVTQSDWTPPTVPALWVEHRSNPDGLVWITDERIEEWTTRLYYSKIFTCTERHVSALGKEPNDYRSHWSLDLQAWTQPVGAVDAYASGDRVTHNSSTWESTVAANVWAPGVFGWVEV